jgi:hypothetical protein
MQTLGWSEGSLNLSEPVINYFYASSNRVSPPGTVTLYYGTQNGASANINGTPVALNNGSMVVSPGATTNYTLTLTNPIATKQTTITIWVESSTYDPTIYRYSVRHEKGLQPFFPFHSLGNEAVNSANGNLFFRIPLLSRPGRNGLGVDLALAYNSRIWDYYVQGGNLYATVGQRDSWVGPGWTLMIARVIDDSANGYYYISMSDGSNHVLRFSSGAWRSRDSSYMIYDPVARRLTLKGGMWLKFDYTDPVRPYERYATRIQDTNGNYIDINYADYGGRISSIQDTLGNTYSFILNSNFRLQYIKYWNTKDTTQATSTITFNYQTQNLVFGSQAATDPLLASQGMLSQVIYPSGMRYLFSYLSSGEISEITYPTCGKSRYSYSTYTVLDRLLGRTVPDHMVSSREMVGSGTWTWSYAVNGQAAPSTTSIGIPGGTVIVNYMQKASQGWADGFIQSDISNAA